MNQKNISNYSKKLIIICDGKIPRRNQTEKRTDEILTDSIFKNIIKNKYILKDAYKTWDNKWNNLDIYTGLFHNIEFIILIKTDNLGKRDSLTLIIRMIYYYNMFIKNNDNDNDNAKAKLYREYINYLSDDLLTFINSNFNVNIQNKTIQKSIDFIIGTDADTILDTNCAKELIHSFKFSNTNKNSSTYNNIVGVVGFVDVVKIWNPLVMYQYCEYLYAQCLRRFIQSNITFKVNCLSGCVQLIKVCNETCGIDILNAFNRLPKPNETIFNHIRSYASEDRNHISIMFSMYPYVKTIQSINAIAYTNVPRTFMTLLRQRKRWSAGATCNDMLLINNSKHNLWERLQSFINVTVFSLTLFIFVSTVRFIISIITKPTLLMLIISIIMIIPLLYTISIPLFIYKNYKKNNFFKNKNKNKYILNNTQSNKNNENNKYKTNEHQHTMSFTLFYYYIGFILYFTVGALLNIIIYFYTLYNIDDLNWNSKLINQNNTYNTNHINNTHNTHNTNNDIINFINIKKLDRKIFLEQEDSIIV